MSKTQDIPEPPIITALDKTYLVSSILPRWYCQSVNQHAAAVPFYTSWDAITSHVKYLCISIICMYVYMQWTSIILMVMRSNFLYLISSQVFGIQCNVVIFVWFSSKIACMPYREAPHLYNYCHKKVSIWMGNLLTFFLEPWFVEGDYYIIVKLKCISCESVIEIIGSWSTKRHPGPRTRWIYDCFDPHIQCLFVALFEFCRSWMHSLASHQWQNLRIVGLVFNIKAQWFPIRTKEFVEQRCCPPAKSESLQPRSSDFW